MNQTQQETLLSILILNFLKQGEEDPEDLAAWSQEEAEQFFDAFQEHGQDWEQVHLPYLSHKFTARYLLCSKLNPSELSITAP